MPVVKNFFINTLNERFFWGDKRIITPWLELSSQEKKAKRPKDKIMGPWYSIPHIIIEFPVILAVHLQ